MLAFIVGSRSFTAVFKDMKNLGNKVVNEIGLKTIFKYILGALFFVSLIFAGVTTIKAGQFVIGVLFFVLSPLVLAPHHYLRVTQALKWVVIIIITVVLLAMSGLESPPVEQKYEYFTLRQEFNLALGNNTFSMVVREVKQSTTITVSGQAVSTSGYFLEIKTDIVNLGSESVDFKFGKDPELKDNQDRRYTLYGATMQEGELHPSVAKEVSYVFEIPKEAAGLNFIVRDKTDIAKSIDLKK